MQQKSWKKRSSFHFSKAGLKWRGHCARPDAWPRSLFGDAEAILLGYGQGVGPPVVHFEKVHIGSYPLITTAILVFCLDLWVSSTSQSYSKRYCSALLLLFSMHVARNMKWNCCVMWRNSKGLIYEWPILIASILNCLICLDCCLCWHILILNRQSKIIHKVALAHLFAHCVKCIALHRICNHAKNNQSLLIWCIYCFKSSWHVPLSCKCFVVASVVVDVRLLMLLPQNNMLLAGPHSLTLAD